MKNKLDIETNAKLGWSTFTNNAFALIIGWIIVEVIGICTCWLLYGPMALGYSHMCLDAARGRAVSVGEVFRGFSNFGSALIWSVIFIIGVIFGFFLALIPGLIFIYVTQWSLLIMADKGRGPVDCIKESLRVNQENLNSTLIFFLFSFAVLMAGNLVIAGMLITGPLVSVICAHGYLRAFKSTA